MCVRGVLFWLFVFCCLIVVLFLLFVIGFDFVLCFVCCLLILFNSIVSFNFAFLFSFVLLNCVFDDCGVRCFGFDKVVVLIVVLLLLLFGLVYFVWVLYVLFLHIGFSLYLIFTYWFEYLVTCLG